MAAGSLRICYDIGLFTMFVNMKLYAHEKNDLVDDGRREGDEEELRVLEFRRGSDDGEERELASKKIGT